MTSVLLRHGAKIRVIPVGGVWPGGPRAVSRGRGRRVCRRCRGRIARDVGRAFGCIVRLCAGVRGYTARAVILVCFTCLGPDTPQGLENHVFFGLGDVMRGSPCSLFCKPMSQVVEGIRVTGGCAEERETARETGGYRSEGEVKRTSRAYSGRMGDVRKWLGEGSSGGRSAWEDEGRRELLYTIGEGLGASDFFLCFTQGKVSR